MEMEYFSPAQPQTKKVSYDIPDDLAFSILSKLSLKSLNRFGCVRKSWTLLFRNPYFMSLFLKNLLCHNRSYYDDTSLLVVQNMNMNMNMNVEDKYELYSLSGEKFESKTKLDWPNPFQEVDPEFNVAGSCSIHGVLCLICYSQPIIRVVLWNPATKELKVIPTSLRESVRYMDVEITRHGFGYDSINDDYKVIRQIMYTPNSDTDSDNDDLPLEDISYNLFWEIYSLRSNSWKKLNSEVPHNYRDEGVSQDGVCHWLGEDGYDGENYDEVYILSFDLSKEVFLITPILSGDDSRYSSFVWKDLLVLNGSIALISAYTQENIFHISLLGELGVKESWTKLYNVCPLPCIEPLVKAGKKGYIFSKVKRGSLVCIDFSTLMVEELSFVGYRYWGKSVIYKESSLPIGEINQ